MGFHANAMKTQFISAYNYYPKYNLSQKQQQSNRQVSTLTPNTSPKAQVSFTGSRPIDLLIRGLNLDPLMHFEKFTKEEYLRLTPAEIKSLRARSFKVIKDSLSIGVNAFDDVHSVSSVILQDMFDNFFGKGKYVVITLGRSLSTVGKALGYRIGEENVVNLPMSWSRRFKPDTTRTCDHFSIYQKINSHQEGLDKFLAYLGKLGLNRDKVLSSGKSYVLMDYCFSGDSMKGAEFLFKSDYVWGPNAKVYTVDILDALSKYDIPSLGTVNKYGNKVDSDIDAISLFTKTFCGSHLKSFSLVGRSISLAETEVAATRLPEVSWAARKERDLVKFRLLDNAMSSKVPSVPKIKSSDGDFQLSGQRVQPWRDYMSQGESDIRNDIQRVNFQLLKLDASDVYGNKDRRDLENLYNNLTDYYNTYSSNPYSLYHYYQSRGKIQSILSEVESTYAGKDIFAQ